MRAFEDFNNVKEYTTFQKLPAGAYKIKILRAEDTSDALCLLFDIVDGEYQDYFKNKLTDDRKSYGADKAKFKGVLRFWYPDGGEHDDSKKRRLKTALKTINDSNRLGIDFTKEWDGAQLSGAVVGMIFRDKEWSYNGKTGFTAQPYSVISLDDLNSGNYKIPEPLTLSPAATAYSAPTAAAAPMTPPLDDDLPF